jgi:phosphoribosylpyrophosphate synthetase
LPVRLPVVIALPASEEHATKLANRLGAELITPELRRFPDGESDLRRGFDRRGREALL